MHRLPLQISLAGLLLSCAAWGDESTAVCPPPEVGDYQPLIQAAEECGTLANALESVANSCFDPIGAWDADKAPRCGPAIAFCEAASVQINRHLNVHGLDGQAMAQMRRPFFDKWYAFAD